MNTRRLLWSLLALIQIHFAVGAATPVTELVPMCDGVRLATDVYLPSQTPGETRPVVLMRTPYGRTNLASTAARWVNVGAAFVAQDVRGRFDSEGENLPFFSDGWGDMRDGMDTVEWIAAQPWCNGRVVMEGNSATAITGILAAGTAPAALRGVLSENGAANLYDDAVFTGGVFRRSLVQSWLALTDADSRIGEFVAHPRRDTWWDPVLLSRRIDTVDVPILHLTGWFDLYASSVLEASSMLNTAGGPGARGRQVVIIGPWGHDTLGDQVQGELVFPNNSLWSSDINQIYGEFHVETLLGQTTGLFDCPTYRYYLMGDVDDPLAPGNEWRESDTWPPVETQDTVYHFRANGGLTPAPPTDGEAEATSFIGNPSNPVPTIGGANLFISAGPRNQSPVESRPDMVTFTTPPLETPMTILGEVRCLLSVSSTALDADFFVKITDVYPDGRSILFMEGATQMRRRNGLDQEDLMVPGEIYDVEISVGHLALALNEGHRLRISVASSNFPRFEPNPQTGTPFSLDDTDAVVATHTIHHGGDHLSRVIIPLQAIEPPPPDNQNPIAVNVSASLREDTSITGNVILNDSDPDRDPLTLVGLTQPTGGTVIDAGNGNGLLRYEPNLNFNGVDAFTYTISDGRGGIDTATVTLNVIPVNDPPEAVDDDAETPEGTPVVIDLLANDLDVDGDAINLTGLGPAVNGSVVNLGGGSVRYTPLAGFTGPDSFAYAIADPSGAVDNAQVIVTVTPGTENRPPVANDIAVTISANSSISGNVFFNDFDPDGDPLHFGGLTQPSNGVVTDIGDGNGNLRYTPNPGFRGVDSFTYTADDGRGGTDTATVRITVQ